MRNQKSWALLAWFVGACAIPNVEIDDSLGGSSGGSPSSDDGGTSNHAGSKNQNGKDGGAGPTTDAGADTGGTSETGQAGEPPSVGGSTGGTASGGSGGTRPAGGTGTGGTGGTGVPPAGAVAKFCNEVTINGAAVDMELRIGTGANMVSIVATTGTCKPVVNHACSPIPIGSAVPVNVFDKANNEVWMAMPKIAAGDAWVFSLYFNDATQMLGFAGKQETTAAQCSSTDFGDLFPGAP